MKSIIIFSALLSSLLQAMEMPELQHEVAGQAELPVLLRLAQVSKSFHEMTKNKVIPAAHEYYGDMAIIKAACGGNIEAVTTYLKNYEFWDDESLSQALIGAAEYGHLGIVQLLLADPRVDPYYEGNLAIAAAAAAGHPEVTKVLFKINPLTFSEAALSAAAQYGQVEVIRMLLDEPLVKHEAVGVALCNATEYNQAGVVAMLMHDHRISRDDFGNALFIASATGNAQILRLLLADPRADILSRTEDAIPYPSVIQSALNGASEYGQVEILESLLQHSSVDLQAVKEALKEAIKNNQEAAILVLLNDSHVDAELFADCLEDVAGHGMNGVLKELLTDPRVTSAAIGQALVQASRSNHFGTVGLLLNDPRVEPAAILQALSIATQTGNEEIAELFSAHRFAAVRPSEKSGA